MVIDKNNSVRQRGQIQEIEQKESYFLIKKMKYPKKIVSLQIRIILSVV